MKRAKWDAAGEKRLAEAWNAGLSSGVLAERFGTSARCIVAKIAQLRRAGAELRSVLGR